MFARLNPGKRRVRFPDEVVFEDHIRESDGDAMMNMLRRASVEIDLDRINMSGMTALHQVSWLPSCHDTDTADGDTDDDQEGNGGVGAQLVVKIFARLMSFATIVT